MVTVVLKGTMAKRASPEETDKIAPLLPSSDTKFCEVRDEYPLYSTFFSLDAANDHAASSYKGIVIPIFASDKPPTKSSNPGAKKFVVCGYQTLWNSYTATDPRWRNLYETILEDVGCHIHVDAEYNRKNNPESDEEWLDTTFKDECIALMMELNYIKGKEDVEIITLVSSNTKKVSKHYIMKMSGCYMKNNYHCGAFARRLRNTLISKYGDVSVNPFFLWGEKETDFEYKPGRSVKDCYMDMAIYTRRRQFRLYFSTKAAGDYRPLLLEEDHALTDNYTKSGIDVWKQIHLSKATFMNCFIQRIQPGWKEVRCYELDGSEPKSTSNKFVFRRDHKHVLTGRLNKKSSSNNTTVTLDRVVRYDSPAFIHINKGTAANTPPIVYKLQAMIEDKLKGNGKVTANAYFYDGDNIIASYGTTSHECEMKIKLDGSGHGGNCIYFIASVQDKEYWQKCHSDKRDVCRFRSPKYKFPERYSKMVDDYYREIKSVYQQEPTIDSFFDMFNPQAKL
jgi:hypothetical protein